jgi:hypothetical protein
MRNGLVLMTALLSGVAVGVGGYEYRGTIQEAATSVDWSSTFDRAHLLVDLTAVFGAIAGAFGVAAYRKVRRDEAGVEDLVLSEAPDDSKESEALWNAIESLRVRLFEVEQSEGKHSSEPSESGVVSIPLGHGDVSFTMESTRGKDTV